MVVPVDGRLLILLLFPFFNGEGMGADEEERRRGEGAVCPTAAIWRRA
jgi:hypothetical protein